MSPAEPAKVLVVDDLETNRFLLEESLAELGAELVFADNGARALEIVGRERPAVVILDFQMPGLDGAETARRIKQLAPSTYVILMSGYRGAEEASVEGSAADCFVAKPYRIAELRRTVSEALAGAARR